MTPVRRSVLSRALLAAACAGAFAATIAPASAEEPARDGDFKEKITVTGSNIPRSDVESALPVQVITREDIERSGSTTVAELMSKVSANYGGFNDQLSIGEVFGRLPRPGLSSVNLRGIGDGSTLVLINGRRAANYAFDGGTVDVNSIPVAAIDRVEILKDGASAIYGSDAMAGVVNFILRKDFQGVEVTGYGSWTQQGGGNQQQAIVSVGYGDIAKDRYNVFVTAQYQHEQALAAADRSFSRTGYLPDQNVIRLNPVVFPANIVLPDDGVLLNPTLATGCAPPTALPATFGASHACGFDISSVADLLPPAKRASVLGRATLQVQSDLQLFAEAGYTANQLTLRFAPTAVVFRFLKDQEAFLYPAGGPYYPTEFAAANGLSGDLNLQYRAAPLGIRTNVVDSRALRTVMGADGAAGGWEYNTAILYSRTQQSDDFVRGFSSQRLIVDAMATGLINPFGPSGPEGEALLAKTQLTGKFHDAKGSTLLVDAKASKEIYRLPGGPLAMAFGAEARHEKLENTFDPVIMNRDIVGASVGTQSAEGSRNAAAFFLETSVPFAKGFESQLAIRYDHYSDFGSTWNPKIALRWQPVKSLMLRGSWGTGFRAPTLYDLHTPLTYGFTPFGFADPVRCPVTGFPDDCGRSMLTASGGNPNLKPETSKQVNAGVVWEPVPGLSLTVDYWRIRKSNAISAMPVDFIFEFYDLFGSTNVIRGPVHPSFPNLPGPIQTVLEWQQNFAKFFTAGVDVDVAWRGPATSSGRFSFGLNGTYVARNELRLPGGDVLAFAGIAFGIPRWRHYAALGWDYGPWAATLGQTFQSGCQDANVDASGNPRRVASYNVWDVQGRYAGMRNATIVLGIKNLFDSDPPFTNLDAYIATGYDPQYADPRGRTFYAQVTLTFK